MKRIGIDVDGVLAAFPPAYQKVIVETSGRDLFLPTDAVNPPCWNWDKFRGYTDEERAKAWEEIKTSPHFWEDLYMLPSAKRFRTAGAYIDGRHEVYFITTRPGTQTRKQTERWLKKNFGIPAPTVLSVAHRQKGVVAKALELDCYIDDNWDNCMDCLIQSPSTHTYLLDCSYNRLFNEKLASGAGEHLFALEARRIASLDLFLREEDLLNYTQ